LTSLLYIFMIKITLTNRIVGGIFTAFLTIKKQFVWAISKIGVYNTNHQVDQKNHCYTAFCVKSHNLVKVSALPKGIESVSQTQIFFSLFLCNLGWKLWNFKLRLIYLKEFNVWNQRYTLRENISLWLRFNSFAYFKKLKKEKSCNLCCLLVWLYVRS